MALRVYVRAVTAGGRDGLWGWLIVRDAQGITGKKVEICSLPDSSIHMWSTENAGVKLAKGADIRRIDSLLAWATLHNH